MNKRVLTFFILFLLGSGQAFSMQPREFRLDARVTANKATYVDFLMEIEQSDRPVKLYCFAYDIALEDFQLLHTLRPLRELTVAGATGAKVYVPAYVRVLEIVDCLEVEGLTSSRFLNGTVYVDDLPNLHTITINNCQEFELNEAFARKASNLKELHVFGGVCGIRTVRLESLPKTLEKLTLDGGAVPYVTDRELKTIFERFSNLKKLCLTNCALSPGAAKYLSNLEKSVLERFEEITIPLCNGLERFLHTCMTVGIHVDLHVPQKSKSSILVRKYVADYKMCLSQDPLIPDIKCFLCGFLFLYDLLKLRRVSSEWKGIVDYYITMHDDGRLFTIIWNCRRTSYICYPIIKFAKNTARSLKIKAKGTLSKDDFDWLVVVPNVQEFEFGDCYQVSAEHFKKLFTAWKKLKVLHASSCAPRSLTDLPPSLERLRCSSKTEGVITGEQLQDALSRLPELKELDIVKNSEITSDELACLENKPIEELNLSDCRNIKNYHFCNLPHLKKLKLNYLKITDQELEFLPEKLELLYLRGCENISNAGLLLLKQYTNLKRLDLCDCEQITDEGLLGIPDGVIEVFLFPQVTDKGLSNFIKRCSKLKRLGFSCKTKITRDGLQMLAELPSLQELAINKKSLTDLPRLSKLTKLYVECDDENSTKVSIKELDYLFTKFPKLQEIYFRVQF